MKLVRPVDTFSSRQDDQGAVAGDEDARDGQVSHKRPNGINCNNHCETTVEAALYDHYGISDSLNRMVDYFYLVIFNKQNVRNLIPLSGWLYQPVITLSDFHLSTKRLERLLL